jgi:RNA polymerase sigma factor for flagellar operon FliA
VRRVRRELEAAREQLRRELGAEPTMADLAARVGTDVTRLERTIVRIHTIESTSPMANLEAVDSSTLPAVLVPSEPASPHRLFEQAEMRDRIRQALAVLPARERKIVQLYYFEDATMKQIGAAIGVNESRVSQLHARAIQRLRQALESRPAAMTDARQAGGEAPALTVRRPQPERRQIAAARRPVKPVKAAPAAVPVRRRLRQVA